MLAKRTKVFHCTRELYWKYMYNVRTLDCCCIFLCCRDSTYIEVLDSTRVHPETYEWARKMAVDALEYDEVCACVCVCVHEGSVLGAGKGV